MGTCPTCPVTEPVEAGKPRRARRHADRGASTVELAILWPAIAAMLFAAIQVACYFTARTVALTAAQAAVTAERQLGAAPQDGVGYAEDIIAQSGDWLRDAEVDGPHDTGDGVSYVVTGDAISIVPWLATWEVSQSAHGTREQFTGAAP